MHHTIQHFGPNETGGRDLIVGDIHGYFTEMSAALFAVGFVPGKDRLFSVGDLVDRGPESEQAVQWLAKPWFHAAMGNHEQAAIAWAEGKIDMHHYIAGFGGGWNVQRTAAECQAFAEVCRKLPIAIELETERGLVLIVHACCPLTSWARVRHELENATEAGPFSRADALANVILWKHAKGQETWLDGPVDDVRAVVVGHTEKERLTQWDNTVFIDTGGWNGGHFTILDAATLLPARSPRERQLDWSGA